MNIVGKINLLFSGRDQLFFQIIYADWDNYWADQIERATDRILKKYNDESIVIEIENLELDLESISQDDFTKKFVPKYEEALENAVLEKIYGQKSLLIKKTEIKKSRKELLFYFLLNGSFSWKSEEIKDLNILFLKVAEENTQALKQFLQKYEHYTGLQQRLVFQFNEDVLKAGIRIIDHEDSHFILSYIELLQRKYQKLTSPVITNTLYNSLSMNEISQKTIAFIFEEQMGKISQNLENEAETDQLLNTALKSNTENQKELMSFESREQTLSFIENSGLVLLAPYLPRLFMLLKLTENDKFKDENAQIRAIFIMQYAVFGSTEFPEYKLQLNKLLTGFSTKKSLPQSITLTNEEKQTVQAMLDGVAYYWSKIRTVDGLRELFLRRSGKLEEKEEFYDLTVESKTFDILLDTIPWSFSTIKFSWMEKPIQVRWR